MQNSGNQTINYTGVVSLNVTGSSGADTFNATPNATTTITVHGGLPTPPASPGERLERHPGRDHKPQVDGLLQSRVGLLGHWTFANRAAVNFDGIETLTQAVPDVAVLKTNGELDLLTPGGALQEISPAGTIQAVSSDLRRFVQQRRFRHRRNPGYVGTLWEHSDAFGWKEISSGSFQQVSATTNASARPWSSAC